MAFFFTTCLGLQILARAVEKSHSYSPFLQLLEWEVVWTKFSVTFPSAYDAPAIQSYGEPLSQLPLANLWMTNAPVGVYSASRLHCDWI